MENHEESFIKYKSADIYFIFSFVLEFNQPYRKLIEHLQEINRLKEIEIYSKNTELSQSKIEEKSDLGEWILGSFLRNNKIKQRQFNVEIPDKWTLGSPPDRQGKPPMLVIKRRTGEKADGGYIAAEVHKKILSEEIILRYYEAPDNEGEEEIFSTEKEGGQETMPRDCQHNSSYKLPAPYPVDAEAYIRIGDNGAGCITFKISITKDKHESVTFRRINHVLSLNQRYFTQEEGISKLIFNSGDKSDFIKDNPIILQKYPKINTSYSELESGIVLFDLFAFILEKIEQEINSPLKVINTKLKSRKTHGHNLLSHDDMGFISGSISGYHERYLSNTLKKPLNFVSILDKKIMDFRSQDQVSQNPYVITIIEIEDKSFWEDFNKGKLSIEEKAKVKEKIKYQHKEMSAILFRMLYRDRILWKGACKTLKNVRIPYELRNSRGFLKNYAWDSNILICLSRVSSLFVCANKSKNPEKFIRKTLLDSLEILRARWHMSIVLNALLDQDIGTIKEKGSSDNFKVLEKLIKRRKQFAYFLDDPLPYHYEGSSVTQIVDDADEKLWLSKLREMTFEKLEVLDKYYLNLVERSRASGFDRDEEPS